MTERIINIPVVDMNPQVVKQCLDGVDVVDPKESNSDIITTMIMDTTTPKKVKKMESTYEWKKLENGNFEVTYFNLVSCKKETTLVGPSILKNFEFTKNGLRGEHTDDKGKIREVLISSFNEKRMYVNLTDRKWNPIKVARFITGCLMKGSSVLEVSTLEFVFYYNETKIACYSRNVEGIKIFGDILRKCETVSSLQKGF